VLLESKTNNPLPVVCSYSLERHCPRPLSNDYPHCSSPPQQASLLDVCGTFTVNRSQLPYQRMYVTSSVADLREQLLQPHKEPPSVADGSPSAAVAVVFTGQVRSLLLVVDGWNPSPA
jgi:hypothetical protein